MRKQTAEKRIMAETNKGVIAMRLALEKNVPMWMAFYLAEKSLNDRYTQSERDCAYSETFDNWD